MNSISGAIRLIEFECRGHRIALPLACVRRVVASAEPAPLPGATDIVLGVLNVGGDIVVAVDLCRRLGLPSAPMLPSQQIVIVELSGFLAGVLVDRVLGVAERVPVAGMPAVLGAAPFVGGVVRLDDGLLMIVDPARFLFRDERHALALALDEVAVGSH
jgi:chemotaxis signal transduction protein